MIPTLQLIYYRLLEATSTTHHRFLFSEFSLKDRLTGLIGPRGVGKTTLMLQYIKAQLDLARVFYFSADHIYFENETLYAFVEECYLTDGIHTFFIDEIHKYKNWSQELKNLYDGFPDIKIVFSGSSSLDITKGGYDLSRRAKMFYLPGMSFREYLNITQSIKIEKIHFNELLSHPADFNHVLSTILGIKGYFNSYLTHGVYPFCGENPQSYHEKLLEVIDKTIYEDIANFYQLNTGNLHLFKKLLYFLASISPGETNIHRLGQQVKIDDKTILNYLTKLEEVGLIHLIYPASLGNASLQRPEKIFLNNTNLQYAIEGLLPKEINIGAVRELFFIQSLRDAGLLVHYSKHGDYRVQDYTFEIGGKNKNIKQIAGIDNSFLVKADILIANKHEIPLMLMGFLY